MDRLRPLVGSKGWDYCVVWRLNEDQRFLECIGCCCAGAETGNFKKQDELLFPVSSQFSCRDSVFQHQRTKCCDLLSQLPSFVPLDFGIYAEVFFSSQPRWLNSFTDPDPNKAATGELPVTRFLIPVMGGLIELFAAKQVPEDHNVVDFIVSQCGVLLEFDALINSSLWVSNNNTEENNQAGSSNMNPQSYEIDAMIVKSGSDMPSQNVEHFSILDLNDKEAVRPEVGRSDSISDCSDQIDDEDDSKCLKRSGKGQAKNLEAERRRRKKLNERLYNLRALVPIISKLDKASILVDAIEYVKQLRKQVEELQEELEQDSDSDEFRSQVCEKGQNVHDPFATRACGADSSHEKVQQMETEVEVTLVDRSKFFIRVFCEHKPGGFVRLLEALCSLGLEVVNVNVTSCRMLVSYVFQVEMNGDTDQVVADDLRNSILELTRIPSGALWPPPDGTSNTSEQGIEMDYHFQPHLLHHNASTYHLHNHI
ncbi:hypothetical protein QQ045_030003 [Rhodiola kirilowii]